MLPMHSNWTLEASDEEVSPPSAAPQRRGQSHYHLNLEIHRDSRERVSDELETLEWVGSCIFLVDHLLSCW